MRQSSLTGFEKYTKKTRKEQFLDALGSVWRFSISGDSLTFYTGDERLILRFHAIALKQNGIHKVHNHTSSTCKLALSKRIAFVQPKIHEPVGVVRNPG